MTKTKTTKRRITTVAISPELQDLLDAFIVKARGQSPFKVTRSSAVDYLVRMGLTGEGDTK